MLEDEFRGGQCRIFKLTFRDKESLAVRVPLYMSVCSQFEKIPVVEMEVEIVQMLEAKGFRWAPKCRGYSLSFDNPLKHPFIVLTWIEGSRLPWNTSFPKQPHRDGLLRQIASIQLSLIECTLENRSTTAKAYFERLLKNRHIRVREGKILDISDQDCVDQQGYLDHVLGQEQDSTIFAIEHGDLKPDNIIIDNKFNIQRLGVCGVCSNCKSRWRSPFLVAEPASLSLRRNHPEGQTILYHVLCFPGFASGVIHAALANDSRCRLSHTVPRVALQQGYARFFGKNWVGHSVS